MVVLLHKRVSSVSGLWSFPIESENTVRPKWLSGSRIRITDLNGSLWPQRGDQCCGDQCCGSRTHSPGEAVKKWWEHNLIIQSSPNSCYRLFCTAVSHVPYSIASRVSVPAPKWENKTKRLFVSMWPSLKGALKITFMLSLRRNVYCTSVIGSGTLIFGKCAQSL